MSNKYRYLLYSLILIDSIFTLNAQSVWPSKSWTNATNLSAVFPSKTAELSGLYWNDDLKRLYAVGDGGYAYILQYNTTTNNYTLLGTADGIGGPEGITQVNKSANEFYTVDENSYEIKKYTHDSNFTSFTKSKTWNLLQSPSPMTNTDNTGPEGIAFVPDSYLQKISFVSSVTGSPYLSVKGMGGLIFIAHQNGGYIWVFDINPDITNDFAYVGKYRTNRTESCDLAFDNSTGLLYVLHNLDDNYLEVTDLKTAIVSGEYKLNKINEYFIPNPASGSTNIEGFAISAKYPEAASMGAWLCRDVSKTAEMADAIRWFSPFAADGNDIRTGFQSEQLNQQNFSIQLFNDILHIGSMNTSIQKFSVRIYSLAGQVLFEKNNLSMSTNLNVKNLKTGSYIVRVNADNHFSMQQKITKTT